MSDLNGDPAPEFRVRAIRRNGDYEISSFDTSWWRRFSGWQISPNSQMYSLASNQLVMDGRSHNVAFGDNGNYTVRDDAGGCSLWLYGEDEVERWYGAPSAAKGTLPVWTQYMTYNSLTGALAPTSLSCTGAITPSQTVGIVGTTTNNSANAGAVGEYLTATIATPGTTLTTATPVNVISAGLSLTAGDWDVWADVCLLPGSTTSITQFSWGLSSTTGTLPAAGSGLGQWVQPATVPGAATPLCEVVCPIRVSQAGTAAIFLVASATFTISSLSAFGTIRARRVR